MVGAEHARLDDTADFELTVPIPVDETVDPDACSDDGATPLRPPRRLLLLEDDEFDALITSRLLSASAVVEFQVCRARTLAEALGLLKTDAFDIALVDMNVPDSHGLETVREIVGRDGGLPTIVLTGDESAEVAVDALQIGAQDYLPKAHADARTLQRIIEFAIQRKGKEKELTSRAYSDALTGLANRALLNDRWIRSRARSGRSGGKVGVLVADIDSFKAVNDRFGHDGGDAVLRHFAQMLAGSVRKSDVVARLGGDEFVVVFENIASQSQLERLCQSLNCVEATVPYEGEIIPYSVSVGLSVSDPHAEEDLMAVVRRADLEMYRRKNASFAGAPVKVLR